MPAPVMPHSQFGRSVIGWVSDTIYPAFASRRCTVGDEEHTMNNIIWWVGAIVIVLFILGYLGFGR